MATNKLPYRPCVGIVLINEDKKVFMAQRVSKSWRNNSETWQMPQGGIDNGETPLSAARRELFEETNVSSIQFIARIADWLHYDFPPTLVDNPLGERYRGQMQQWFLFRFSGADSEVDIATPANGESKPEFENWCWTCVDQVVSRAIFFKRNTYRQVMDGFAPYLIA